MFARTQRLNFGSLENGLTRFHFGLRAVGFGPWLRRPRWLGCVGATHSAPRIGGGLGIRDFAERFLVRLVPRRLGFLLLWRLGLQLRHQIDVRDLRVGRACQNREHSRQAENSHRMLPRFPLIYTT